MEESSRRCYVGYEYKTVDADRYMQDLYSDNYSCFGWELERVEPAAKASDRVRMHFRRERKIACKPDLIRLQSQFDAHAAQIDKLEKSKTKMATVYAVIVGAIGVALLAGAIFSYLGGIYWACALLGVLSAAGFVLPYFCYIHKRNKKTRKVAGDIESLFDMLYSVCDKAQSLIQCKL